MNALVKIIRDDDGQVTKNDDWHLVDPGNPQGPATTCTSEFFGPGESAVEYEVKNVKRGGITCPDCIRRVKAYKAVRLT